MIMVIFLLQLRWHGDKYLLCGLEGNDIHKKKKKSSPFKYCISTWGKFYDYWYKP